MFVSVLGGNEALYSYCRSEADRITSNPNNLTDDERLAIWIYSCTNLQWHEAVNGGLWSATPSEGILFFAELLNEAIAKLPKYKGLVYRGYRTKTLDEFLRTHRPGESVCWRGFTSCTSSIEWAFAGNLLFTITSQNGRLLGGYADDPKSRKSFSTARLGSG